MQFESMIEFVAMGGHGLYVWLAYGTTCAVLIGSVLSVRIAAKKQMQQLRLVAFHQTRCKREP
ncbi:MAG: heme exporter protein CcmD [Gammaproteobacteria bacterium]|nr:heme exporter protein CcmD [Gammaproteobacteria bacterium]